MEHCDLYIPQGTYRLWEKDFAIHPIDFEVSQKDTRVIIQPTCWFRLTFSDDVHPSDIELSYDGTEWKDFTHVPFGSYRLKVKNKGFTYPFVKVTFLMKRGASLEQEAATQSQSDRNVVVEERGTCRLLLRQRNEAEKIRYNLLGY